MQYDSFIHSVNSFIVQSVLRQTHSLFRSEFSNQYDLVLPFQIPTHAVAVQVFFLVFSSILSFLQ